MVSYHIAKFGGPNRCSKGDITILVFEKEDPTCDRKSAIAVYL